MAEEKIVEAVAEEKKAPAKKKAAPKKAAAKKEEVKAEAKKFAKATTHVMGLEFVEVGIFRPILSEMMIVAERVQIREHDIALDLARVFQVDMGRVGIGALHFLRNILRRIG